MNAEYSKVWAKAIIRYVTKYFDLLGNPVGLDAFKKHKRNNVLKALSAYSKFTGTYSDFKQKLKDYGIKWGRTDSLSSFLRMVNNNGSDVKEWYNKAQAILRPNEQLYLRYVLTSGLRKNEAIQSFNLVNRLYEENRLADYYNEELQTLEHFRFKDLFLRRTKNVFISFVPKSTSSGYNRYDLSPEARAIPWYNSVSWLSPGNKSFFQVINQRMKLNMVYSNNSSKSHKN